MQQLKNRTLFFGDNLRILERIPDESFDLIYLDPPFNSNRNYNVLFKEGKVDSAAQIHAFEDTWEWTPQTIQLFDDLQNHRNPKIAILVSSAMTPSVREEHENGFESTARSAPLPGIITPTLVLSSHHCAGWVTLEVAAAR